MRISILKYFVPNYPQSQVWKKNYFANYLTRRDKIVFDKVLKDSFPVFTEEWEDSEDANILKTGFFDLSMSLYSEVRSEVDGFDLKNFFLDGSTAVTSFKYEISVYEFISDENGIFAMPEELFYS